MPTAVCKRSAFVDIRRVGQLEDFGSRAQQPRQPEMVPSSLTNKNRSLLKPAPPLKTCPVTLPSPGIVTIRFNLAATFVIGSTEYKVETPVPLLEIQNGLVPEAEMPQGLTN